MTSNDARFPGGWPASSNPELVHDGRGNLVLNRKDVRELAIETLGPELIAVLGVDELRRDAHAVARLSNAALESRSDPQPPADLGDLEILCPEKRKPMCGKSRASPGTLVKVLMISSVIP